MCSDPCSVYVGFLNYVAWTEFSCGVRFAIYLCINFPIFQNIFFVDLLYFLILYWGVMKIWTVWFFFYFIVLVQVMLCFSFSSKTCWGLWIIVWIWAFSFFWPVWEVFKVIIYLGLQNQIVCLGSQTKGEFGWIFKETQINMIGHFFHFFFFWGNGS